MKRLIVILGLLALAGCTQPQQPVATTDLKQVPGLTDCTYHRFYSGHGSTTLIAVRCPNSSTTTTYQSGKTSTSVVVIDGVEYVRREP
jgi:hypothetical protein